MATDKLPPGKRGLRLLGETLTALRNMNAFPEDKQQQYGNVFRANVLGKKVVVVSGPSGAVAFQDQDRSRASRRTRHTCASCSAGSI